MEDLSTTEDVTGNLTHGLMISSSTSQTNSTSREHGDDPVLYPSISTTYVPDKKHHAVTIYSFKH